jgi:Xaa-Pro aminopeptidase
MEAIDTIPHAELESRWTKVRQYMSQNIPQAQGMIVMSRALMYWLTGHWGNGFFWLPLEGNPVLMVRKGKERAKLESGVQDIFPFRSPGQIPQILSELGQRFPSMVGIDMGSISWAMGQTVRKKLPKTEFIAADQSLAQARAVKSQWELNVFRLAGERHNQVLTHNLPQKIQPGMSEKEIAQILLTELLTLGHQGQVRMNGPGEEFYAGVVSAGDSGNYPTVSSGPVGYRGLHPAVPQMGYAGQIWNTQQPFIADAVFQLEGYHTDKTQVYFAGTKKQIPGELKDAHRVCQEIHNRLAESLRPGVKPSDLYAQGLEMAGQTKFEAGFMGLGGNKVPFVGHGIGVFLDDWPVVAAKFDTPLEENMVLALEPKIGISGQGMVGVENTFQVTAQGGISLTGNADDMICVQE